MTNQPHNTQELDGIMDKIYDLAYDHLPERGIAIGTDRIKQSILDWHNKQVEEVLDRLESERDSHDADTGCSDELGYIPLSAIQAERIKLQAGGDWQGIAILTAMKLKERDDDKL